MLNAMWNISIVINCYIQLYYWIFWIFVDFCYALHTNTKYRLALTTKIQFPVIFNLMSKTIWNKKSIYPNNSFSFWMKNTIFLFFFHFKLQQISLKTTKLNFIAKTKLILSFMLMCRELFRESYKIIQQFAIITLNSCIQIQLKWEKKINCMNS